MAYTVCLWLKP